MIFMLYLCFFLVLPVIVLGLVLAVINRYRDNRKYLEYEEEVYEGRKAEADMPGEPYESM